MDHREPLAVAQAAPCSAPPLVQSPWAAGQARRRAAASAMLAALAFGGVTLLVTRFDTVAVLVVAGLMLTALTLWQRPELATLLAVFLFYINVPAILTQQHGVPT